MFLLKEMTVNALKYLIPFAELMEKHILMNAKQIVGG